MEDGEMATSTGASEVETVRLLRQLMAQLRDSEAGYRRAYGEIRDPSLRVEFGRLVEEREDMIEGLDGCLADLGQAPDAGGTMLGAAHRLFFDLRTAISGRDREAILREIVRGESVLEESYDATIRAGLPPAIHNIVRRQHRLARGSRDRFRAMIADLRATEPVRRGLSAGGVASAARRNPVLSSTLVAALAAGFAAALWMTRHHGRR